MVAGKNENEMGKDNDAIGGPKSDQTAVGDAIRKTAQETKKLYTRKLHGIPRSCPEIPRSSLEYEEGDFDEVNRQTDTHTHTHIKKLLWNTKKLFSNTMLLRNAKKLSCSIKKLSCNTKKLLWNTTTVCGIQGRYLGIPIM